MKKTLTKTLEAVCGLSLLLAVMGCENLDGSPNFAFIVPMLAICAVSGTILKVMETKRCRELR